MSNAPAAPCQCAELNISADDLIKWHTANELSEEHAELIKQLQIDLTIMDGPKIKDDITNLVKAGKTYMTKDEI